MPAIIRCPEGCKLQVPVRKLFEPFQCPKCETSLMVAKEEVDQFQEDRKYVLLANRSSDLVESEPDGVLFIGGESTGEFEHPEQPNKSSSHKSENGPVSAVGQSQDFVSTNHVGSVDGEPDLIEITEPGPSVTPKPVPPIVAQPIAAANPVPALPADSNRSDNATTRDPSNQSTANSAVGINYVDAAPPSKPASNTPAPPPPVANQPVANQPATQQQVAIPKTAPPPARSVPPTATTQSAVPSSVPSPESGAEPQASSKRFGKNSWITKMLHDEENLGVNHGKEANWKAFSLAWAMVVLGVFLFGPVIFEMISWIGKDFHAPLGRWAFFLIFFSALQMLYACFLSQVPDWSTTRFVSYFMLAMTVVSSFLLALALLSGVGNGFYEYLQLSITTKGKVCGWLLVMSIGFGMMSYLCGLTTQSWMQDESRRAIA